MFKDELQRQLSEGVNQSMGSTLHELRRKNKYKSNGIDANRSKSTELEERGGSTFGSSFGSSFGSLSDMRPETPEEKQYLGPVTSRLEGGLGNTTFSIHEQPRGSCGRHRRRESFAPPLPS